jgi:hypothetical protein
LIAAITIAEAIMAIPSLCSTMINGTSPWTIISLGWSLELNAGRGTLDIIWSCLVTIFACSWTVTHPGFKTPGDWGESKVVLYVSPVVAPEILAYKALDEYIQVRAYFKIFKHMNKGHWTMSQLFFIFMGGVDLEFEDCTEILGCAPHGKFYPGQSLLNAQRALQLNILDMRFISVEDVKERAKTSYLVKALVCLQASWLVVQVIGRAVAKLPITTLGVVTVGYVVCALITYSCWWHKLQDAEVSITVNCRSLTGARFHELMNDLHDSFHQETWREMALSCVVCGTFGAVYCIAWNFYFSTFAESAIWKVSSVLTIVIPFIYASSFANLFPGGSPDGLLFMLLLAYIPVRLYLMIEPFVAFRSVPVGIFYTVNWSNWIPHV